MLTLIIILQMVLGGCAGQAPRLPGGQAQFPTRRNLPPPPEATIGRRDVTPPPDTQVVPASHTSPVHAQIRGQNGGSGTRNPSFPPNYQSSPSTYQPPNYSRQPNTSFQLPPFSPPPAAGGGAPGVPAQYAPGNSGAVVNPGGFNPPGTQPFVGPETIPPGAILPGEQVIGGELGLSPNFANIEALVEEARTGRFMVGVGVNSSAGITGQIVLDERNFDITRVPTGFHEFVNGTAFRGAGQGFRLEALPGTVVQRYLFSFTEPYLFQTPISLSVSGFFFDRNFFDWDEQRFGGRVALGYRLTHDLSLSAAMRVESIDLHDPRVRGVPELEAALGDSEAFAPGLTLTHDTRDIPFAATQGHLIELSAQYVLGSFDYARLDGDYRRYHLLFERPDGSGRHTFSYGFRAGYSGSQTPIYDNYFAGGFSTLRGFDFRGASPVSSGVTVGGEVRLLGSVEYTFPLTADDMFKGVVFCDFGTVEETTKINGGDVRVAPGFGFRLNIPAMGPAPLAFDFAFPVASEATDDEQIFSFFIGLGRL